MTLTPKQLSVLVDVVKDARTYSRNRALFHEAHVQSVETFREGNAVREGSRLLADDLEYHRPQAEWHRRREADLTEVLAALKGGEDAPS